MRLPTRLAVVTAALFASSPAWALSCEEIMSMVDVNVPSNIVVQTMDGSGTRFTATDIKCLTDKGAPSDVLAAAKRLSAGPDTTTDTSPTKKPPPPDDTNDQPSGFDSTQTLGGDTTPDAGGDTGEDTSTGPKDVEDMIKLYRAKKLLTSTKMAYDLLDSNQYPDDESKISYYLAKGLYDLQMYHSAQHYFMEVVRKGPKNPYFKYALPKLVAIAEQTGDDTELLRFVDKIPPESYPRQAKNHLYYLMGRKLYEDGKLSEAAKYFGQVSAKSELYLKAKYYEGVISNQRGKLKSAVKSFRDVYQSDIVPDDDKKLREYEDLKDLALMNIARIYFAIKRYDNADNFYSLVDRDSTYWAESLFERAYTSFWVNDLNGTLGLLLTVRSPYYADEEYIPEVEILRSLAFYNLCEFDETDRILIDFDAKYAPMKTEMEEFLAKYDSDDGRKLADQAYDDYFTDSHKGSKLSKALFLKVLRNRDLADLVKHLDSMKEEKASIDAQKDAWKGTIGTKLKEIMDDDERRLKRRAGNVLIDEIRQEHDALADLLTQAEIIKFEVVDAQRKVLESKMVNPDVDTVGQKPVDFATSTKIIYWPFNGEFWQDELGYYRYTEESQCNKK